MQRLFRTTLLNPHDPAEAAEQDGHHQELKRSGLPQKVGAWAACVMPGGAREKFRADAVIGNPVAYTVEHCAEALGVPAQILFTMPWSCFSIPHLTGYAKEKDLHTSR